MSRPQKTALDAIDCFSVVLIIKSSQVFLDEPSEYNFSA